MLKWALIFFVISLIAGIFRFSGVSAATAGIAKILFFIAIIIFAIFILFALFAGQAILSRSAELPLLETSCRAYGRRAPGR